MSERRSVHRTQWAAQFSVAGELCKRGYQVAFTMGNHPQIDLMVVSRAGKHFVIDVKGQYKKNFWVISPKKKRNDLYYVLAFVPDDQPNQFFVLTQAEVNREISRIQKRSKATRVKKGLSVDKVGLFPGLTWGVAERFRGKWDKLPK